MSKVVRRWLFSRAAFRAFLQLILAVGLMLAYMQMPPPPADDPGMLVLKSAAFIVVWIFWIAPIRYFAAKPLKLMLFHFDKQPTDFPCPICGYDIRITPHRCPECGTKLRWGMLSK